MARTRSGPRPSEAERLGDLRRLVRVGERDELLGLVDEDEERLVAAEPAAERPAEGAGLGADEVGGALLGEAEVARERGGEREERAAPGEHGDDAPDPRRVELSVGDEGKDAGAAQRRLAHARVADDEDDRLAAQPVEDGARLGQRPKKSERCVGLEGAQARGRGCRRGGEPRASRGGAPRAPRAGRRRSGSGARDPPRGTGR